MDAAALHRVMRALASLGVFAQTSGGRFATTAISELLMTEAPQSLRDVASLYGEPWLWQVYGAADAQRVHWGSRHSSTFTVNRFYDFLASHPDEAAPSTGR